MTWVPLLWLMVTLALLLMLERWIHRHLQGVMLLLTGDTEIAVVLYALPLLPGIFVHEMSHALAAAMLNVRVGRITIRPRQSGKHVQLGFVPIERTDKVRASLIGLAPLLAGSAIILLIGYLAFGLSLSIDPPGEGWRQIAEGLTTIFAAPDAWLWGYAIFTVSNTMLPSRSDRQAWTPVILFMLLAALLVWVAGLGPAVLAGSANVINTGLQWLATMCSLTITIDLPFVLLIALTEKLLERVRGVHVEY